MKEEEEEEEKETFCVCSVNISSDTKLCGGISSSPVSIPAFNVKEKSSLTQHKRRNPSSSSPTVITQRCSAYSLLKHLRHACWSSGVAHDKYEISSIQEEEEEEEGGGIEMSESRCRCGDSLMQMKSRRE